MQTDSHRVASLIFDWGEKQAPYFIITRPFSMAQPPTTQYKAVVVFRGRSQWKNNIQQHIALIHVTKVCFILHVLSNFRNYCKSFCLLNFTFLVTRYRILKKG